MASVSAKSLFLAARPKTLPAAIVPVWAGSVLAWKLGGTFDGWLAFLTLAGAICIQIATNFFNDVIDFDKGADTDRRLGPTRVTAGGLMARRTVMRWGLAFLLGATACGAGLAAVRGWPILAIGIPSMLLAYGYTGGPWPLAYRGMGELFVVLFFGLVAVSGTVFVQTGGWHAEALLLGLQVGLLSAVLISVNNLRDREEDASTGKKTLAVRLGHRVALAVIWLEINLAALVGIAWFRFGHLEWMMVGVPVMLLGFRIMFGLLTTPPGPAYNRLLALSGIQLIGFAIAFHVMVVWVPSFSAP